MNIEQPRVQAFIFARGGSKGVPNKNIRPLAGLPLIAHAINAALKARYVKSVIVSTDSEVIAAIAREYNAEVLLRPAELATDTSPELLSWKHALKTVFKDAAAELDVMVSVPTVAPLRTTEDIDRCVNKLLETNADLVMCATEASNNPSFSVMKIDAETEQASYYCQTADVKPITRRQDAVAAYDVTPVAYATKPSYILECEWLLEGKVRLVQVPRENAVDIDTEFDFKMADALMRERMRDMLPDNVSSRSLRALQDLSGCVVAIMDVPGRIGSVFAECFAELGADIMLVAEDENEAKSLAFRLQHAYGCRAIISMGSDGALERVKDEFGRLDVCVNCGLQTWNKFITECIPMMKNGSIINLGCDMPAISDFTDTVRVNSICGDLGKVDEVKCVAAMLATSKQITGQNITIS